MKNVSLYILLIVLVFTWSTNSFAQNPVPNDGFESWSGNTPTGWSAPTNISGFFEPITKSTDAYTGNFAVRGEVLNAGGSPVVPIIYTGSPSQQTFPVSENHISLEGSYKFSPQGGDMLYIEIVFYNTTVEGGAEGHVMLSNEVTGTYLGFEIPMEYDEDNPVGWQATEANITVTILPPDEQVPHVGTWFLVDHFTFDGYPLDVDDITNGEIPDKFGLEQNYPNPFNPTTNINFNLPEESFVNLKVFNIQGEEVATLVNEELAAGSYKAYWNAAEMSSGIYVYVLRTKDINLSRKMILMK
ncbi:MAG: hypothetical protein A2000_12825 [Ignavibacteria bacterium GWB2_36_8]|nr:MAG: hypothetical protein A2000_12825 [Ignavibacteria bacterium GWB2_36_8]